MFSLEIIKNILNDIELALHWTPNNSAMATGGGPSPSNWTLEVDGYERAITYMVADGGDVTTIYASGAAATSDFLVKQVLYDAAIKNTDGIHALPGQQVWVEI